MTKYDLKADKDDLKSMIILFNTHKALVEVVKKDIKKYGYDLNEFSVFEVVFHKGKLTVQEIKEKILVANSSLTYILDKLEKKEIITRTRDEFDKRIFYIELTEKGTIEANSIFPKHYERLRSVFSILDNEDKNTLNTLLKKVGYNTKE
ncbi:MarR family winged helix-turn-helix transcriptional regulator [Haploplasma axanthum]|uniref:MarR family transcriptional regulator n=1 Tax=Haploplasma axanthum TaxID=29552 RepID=A0A449BDB2_HAPAX|nr:MarR family transcriptional regulator [Haploplasma axanthum]VEU80415.1 MarR family transcriptional regulator [Haploplasma axanthum]